MKNGNSAKGSKTPPLTFDRAIESGFLIQEEVMTGARFDGDGKQVVRAGVAYLLKRTGSEKIQVPFTVTYDFGKPRSERHDKNGTRVYAKRFDWLLMH